jgi:hypothetical protein
MCRTRCLSGGWRRGILLAAALGFVAGAGVEGASAQFRLDATFCIPFQAKAPLQVGIPQTSARVLPLVQAGWQLTYGSFRLGFGLDALVLVFENALWPDIFVEYELNPFVLRAEVGGGLIVLASPYGLAFRTTMLPQLDVSFKLTSWIRLSIGILAFTSLGGQPEGPRLPEVAFGYIGMRFSLFGSERSNRR